jgi:hypothetical protein
MTRFLLTLAIGGALLTVPLTTQTAIATPEAASVEPRAAPARSAVIPISVTLGGGSPLPGARVVVKDSKGVVALTARTNSKGFAFAQRSQLPSTFTVTVSGGSAWKKFGQPRLQTTDAITANETRVIFVSPVTGVASIVAKRTGVSYTEALRRTKRAMGLPSWLSAHQFSTVFQAFSSQRLREWSQQHGSVGGGIRELGRRVSEGKRVPQLSPMFDGISTRGTATWVGETVMAGILKGSASAGAEMAIGDVFGQPNPTTDALENIANELSTISAQLTQLQASMNQLTAIMEQAELDTLTASMTTIMGNVDDQWPVYQFAMSLDPTSSDYTATLAGFVQDFKADIGPFIGEFNALFSSPAGPGVIQTLYANNDAPWWTSADVGNIQSTIDYFGTYQAMATALLNESWWFTGAGITGETPQYIQTENAKVYQPQNSNIYLSIPTSVDTSSVVVPSEQMIYRIFGGTVSHVQEQANLVNANGSCSKLGTPGTYNSVWPTVLPSTTSWAQTWDAMVTNPSFVTASSSAFAQLAKPRTQTSTTGAVTTSYSLPTLASGAPGAFAMVSSQSAPVASFITYDFGTPDAPIFWSWLWCNNATVSLVNATGATWEYNFGMDYSGDNLPGNKAAYIYEPIPVGVLAQQQGSFSYISP